MCFFLLLQAPESEERTPGRLQAVWPPPQPKDKEEKIGLKYTEAGKWLRNVKQMFVLSEIFAFYVMAQHSPNNCEYTSTLTNSSES